MPLYYIELQNGTCGIREYKSLRQCISQETKLNGIYNFKSATLATEEKIGWVKRMGGHIPKRQATKSS